MASVWLGWRDGSWRRVERAGVLRVGYALEAPYAFFDERGQVTGEAPEIARAVTKRLGLGEPEWVLTDFGALLDDLEAGRFDLVAAGMFVTEERAERVVFSRATAVVRPGLLVAAGNPHNLHSYADAIRHPEVRLAVLAGSVEARALAELGMPRERVVTVPDALSGLTLLKTGRADGLALSRPTVRWMARSESSRDWVESAEPFVALGPDEDEERVAFAFRRGDRNLRRRWDRELAAFMKTDDFRRIEVEFGFMRRGAREEAR